MISETKQLNLFEENSKNIESKVKGEEKVENI